jgi:hypothetical protein
MRVKFLRAAVLALGLFGLAPLAVAQEGGFGSPSLMPVSSNPRLSSIPSEEGYGYRRASWQDDNRPQDLPPPATPQDYPGPTPAEPAIGAGVGHGDGVGCGCQGGAPSILGGYSQGTSAWSDGSCSSGSCYGNEFGNYGCGGCAPPRCGIFGSAGALFLSKGGDDFNQLSFNDADPAGVLLSTQNSAMETFVGGQFEVGYWFSPSWGISATYWGAWGPDQTTTVDAANLGGGNLNTVFDFGALNIGATNVNTLFDGAQRHALTRSYDLNNVEISLVQGSYYNNSGSFGVGFLAGARWFQYGESFLYQSSDADLALNTGVDDVNYFTRTTNDLIGFQVGARVNYQPWQRLRFFAAPKFGIYNNQINLDSTISGPGGVAVVGPGNVFAGQAYDIHSSVNDVAFLGEIGVGADINITQYWALTVGYRAVTATGIAQPFEQIPQNFAGLNDAADINRNGSVLIHGAYAGVSYNY